MKTDVNNFIEQAIATESKDFEAIIQRLTNVRTIRLLHATMGMATESGELLDNIKKHIFYGKEIDLVNVEEEFGDALWYTALGLNEVAVTFEQVMEKVINKLRVRYPDKFKEIDALNRNLAAERKELEK